MCINAEKQAAIDEFMDSNPEFMCCNSEEWDVGNNETMEKALLNIFDNDTELMEHTLRLFFG